MHTKIHILSNEAIAAKMLRMAYEVYEKNFLEEEIIIIGVSEGGDFLANKLEEQLSKIAPFRIIRFQAEVNRAQTQGMMALSGEFDKAIFREKSVIVVDDVLYSGRTLLSAVAQILTAAPKCIQTFVLIDRGHRQMPISPDFVGMELATTLQQHVSFEILTDGKVEAFLI